VAEQVRLAVERTRLEGAGVTVSVGVAAMPRDGTTAEELLDAADEALACALELGGNRVISAERCRKLAEPPPVPPLVED
jgi:GGDEF domain-containing protein